MFDRPTYGLQDVLGVMRLVLTSAIGSLLYT